MRMRARSANVDRVWLVEPDRVRCGGLPPPNLRLDCPAEHLPSAVSSIVVGRESFEEPSSETVVSDGQVRIVVEFGDGREAIVEGPTMRPTVLELAGTIDQVAITIRPGAVRSVLGVPAHELRDSRTPLADLWGTTADEWIDTLASAPVEHRGVRAARLVQSRLEQNSTPPADELVGRAVATLSATTSQTRVSEVAERYGIGDRRLQDRFRTSAGLTPKEYARLARLRDLWRRIDGRCPGSSLAGVAHDAGFADQAHAAREVRTVSGYSLTELLDLGFVQDGPAS